MTRQDYTGPVFGMIGGVCFKLDVTVEQINKALEENKQLKDLQEKYDREHQMCEDLYQEGKKLHAMISKARRELSFDPDNTLGEGL